MRDGTVWKVAPPQGTLWDDLGPSGSVDPAPEAAIAAPAAAQAARPAASAGRPAVRAAAPAAPAAPAADCLPTEHTLLATDGSCLRNPGGATGWAYVRIDGAWAYGSSPSGTNQIGELQAVVLALTDHQDDALEIQCDSSYAIGCATTWKKGWQRNNYVNSQRKTVSNLEIIRELHRLIDARTAPLVFTKVKGHDLANRWPLNTAVDVVCGQAAVATQAAGRPVFDSGVLQINWQERAVRGSPRG